MQFKLSSEPLEKIKADLVFILCQQRCRDKDDKGIAVLQKSDGGLTLDKLLGGLLSRVIRDESFRGELGTTKLVYTSGRMPARLRGQSHFGVATARAVLMVGAGKRDESSPDAMRKIGASIAKTANSIKVRSLAGIIQNKSVIQALVEGALLGTYKFERYKDKKDLEPDTLKEFILIAKGGRAQIESAIKKGEVIADAVNLARDLTNTPANDMTPAELAKTAERVAREGRLTCSIWGPKEIAEAKMGLFLAVARGSANEPRFIHMRYKPAGKPKAKIALIGKGITFDSGGYDLKPGRYMIDMKGDMAGGAVCIAVMKVLSILKPKIQVDTYIPATDNMIDAKAEVPGNIVRARNGKTVELINMDSEGRLALADAIVYANEKRPDLIIDIATLTGGVLYALGEIYTAILGNDQRLIGRLIAASKGAGELMWQLPLVKEYKKGYKDGPADLKNRAKTKAETIAGGLFLEEFVGSTKWAHLDIAETAMSEEERDYTPKGATGAGVRTIVNFLTGL